MYTETDRRWVGEGVRSELWGSLPNGMARREIGEVSISVPHTRKSLVKGERFIRECMKDLSYAGKTTLPGKYQQAG